MGFFVGFALMISSIMLMVATSNLDVDHFYSFVDASGAHIGDELFDLTLFLIGVALIYYKWFWPADQKGKPDLDNASGFDPKRDL